MKTILDYVRQRRWCQVLLAGVILFLLAHLHPRVRDTLFGNINGWSRSTWETRIRANARHEREMRPASWYGQALEKLGIRPDTEKLDWHDERLLPTFLDLAEDPDEQVRCFCLYSLDRWKHTHHAEVVEAYRLHLQDSDPKCRLSAADGLWRATRDPEIKPIVLELCQSKDTHVLCGVADLMGRMIQQEPDLIEPLSDLAEGPNEHVSTYAVSSVLKSAKPRLSIVRCSLRSDHFELRLQAMQAASRVGKDAEKLIPELLKMRDTDGDPFLRENAAAILAHLDPKRFPRQGN